MTMTRGPQLPYSLRLKSWLMTRSLRLFLQGVPALALGLVVVAVAASLASQSDRDVHRRYVFEAKAALQAKNTLRAVSLLERAVQEEPGSSELRYQLALAVEASGDVRRATVMMMELASQPSNGPANYWLARKLLAGEPTRQSMAAAEKHLLRSLETEIEERDAVHGLLGQLYLGTNRPAEAEFHLLKASTTRPIFRLPLARAYQARGNSTRARQEAELAIKHYRDRARSDLTNHIARLAWADAVSFLEDYPAAVAVLEEGHRAEPAPIYAMALGRVYVSWLETKRHEKDPEPSQFIDLIEKGLAYDPSNQQLWNALLEQLQLGSTPSQNARRTLESMLTKGGKSAGKAHFGLAVDARLRGQPDEERIHLELAIKHDPNTPSLANNLAWALLHRSPPELPKALELANVAVNSSPKVSNFRDTRGRVYFAMGRNAEAIVDLESALISGPDTIDLHDTLAAAYRRLGNNSMASKHAERSAELKRK